MTMHNITAKLRKRNQGQYRLLGICIFLSVLLVSSFTMMFFSDSVQEFLPPGGDTRKLMWLMLGVVGIGCLLFTLYGSSLFFRGKSREFGVMLALGAEKKVLARQLAGELAAVVGKYILSGILAAVPVSYLIWKLFQLLVVNTSEMQYRFGIAGILAGLLFAALLSLCILFLGIRFIRRSNIMEILNTSRKTEMVREIQPWCKKLGVLLIVAGLFLAMAVPQLTVRLFRQGMPAVWNVTYLLSVAGLYLVILSAVGHSARGKHPENYYRHIISTNLMRFTARQTTRNMCVISLLVFVMVLSAFWGVMYYYSATEGGSEAPYDYSLHYPAGEAQIGREEIEELAQENGVHLTSYEELESLELIIQYTGRDMDDQRRYFDVTYEKLASFISASEFTRISGIPVSLEEGEYQTITTTGFLENIWVSTDCLDVVEHPLTGERILPAFRGTVEFDNLAIASEPFAFLLSDADYSRMAEGLGKEWKEKQVLFHAAHGVKAEPQGTETEEQGAKAEQQEIEAEPQGTEDKCQEKSGRACSCESGRPCPEMYRFADAVKNAYVMHATALSNHHGLYDAHEEELALAAGETYGYAGEIDLSPDHMQILDDWKYAPFMKVLLQAGALELVAVFVMLSLYISVISLSAAGMMSYIRSITIALDNRQLFEDLRKLGADSAYEENVIKVQLRKIFAYPVAAGCTIVILFSLLLTYFNDMMLQSFEVRMLLMEGGLILLIAGIMYSVYRVSYRKMKMLLV